MAGKYIVQPTRQGLLFIDQHRAHAILLYDQCLKRLQEHNGEVQQLLFPEIWDVGVEDRPLVESLLDYFHDLGFVLSRLTKGSYNVTGVPVLLTNQSALLTLQQLLDSMREMGETARDERERHIAWTMAESAALPYGKSLTEDEINTIVARFLQHDNARLTPSGKKAAVLFTGEMINNLF
jgi:DNA mismatch repair protein MutL